MNTDTSAGSLETDPESNADNSVITTIVRWGFYPFALTATLLYIFAEIKGHFGALGRSYPVYLGTLIAIMVTLEYLRPMRREWGMTHKKFLLRDLPMLAINGVSIGLTTLL